MESIDHLRDYPHGCVEQTVSRFLPGLALEEVATGLGADDEELAAELLAVVESSLQRLYRLQNRDGGWGWSESDDSDVWQTAYAVYGLKATLVPMFEQQRQEEWRFILADCGARAVIGATAEMVMDLEAAKPEVPSLEHVIGLSLPEQDVRSYAAILKQGALAPRAAEHPDPDDLAGLIYTSGTTGNPKGVMLTHRNICSNVSGFHAILRFEPDDRSLSFLPWAHVFGQTAELHDLISTGSAIAINDDVGSLVANLAVVKPTVLFAVPRIFNRIYEGVNRQIAQKPRIVQKLFHGAIKTATRRRQGQQTGALDRAALVLADRILFSKIRAKFGGRIKYAVSGSAALGREVGEFVDALGIAVFEGYGLTETSPAVSSNYPGANKLGSVGKPLPGVQVRIEQVHDCDSPQGEIVVLGPNVMRGYHNRPEENEQAFTPDGGLRTGDLGYLDEDGYLYVTGRIKEQYKLENGRYVVPSPLEEALKLSPYIANVMLYGANRPTTSHWSSPTRSPCGTGPRSAVSSWVRSRETTMYCG